MIEDEKTGLFFIDPTQVEMIPIDDIKLYKRNAKKHTPEQIEQIVNSIQAFGMNDPIAVWGDENIIVEGHGRYLALRSLGEQGEIPCIRLDHLTDEQRKAYALAHNQLTMNTGWNDELLLPELDELGDFFDMSDFGFSFGEDEEQTPAEITEDDAPELDEVEPCCKRGQIWQLGTHRLMCGDSTSADDVSRLMNGEKADMVFTDPPYGVNVRGGKGHGGMIQGDLTQTTIPFSFDLAVTKATKQKSHFYFCGAEANLQLYQMLFDRYLHILPKHLIWVKNGFVMKQNGYHNQFEIIYHGYKEGSGGLWYGGRTEDEASDVWRIKRDPSVSYVHPTQKPIEIPARAIRNSCPPRGSVLDMFGGSGSTLIACEQLDRRCFMMELDPHYCDVIIKRWENLTGQTAELLED